MRGRAPLLRLPLALIDGPDLSDPDSANEEERRLFYVAMTRARDELILSHASNRAGREAPSRPIALRRGGAGYPARPTRAGNSHRRRCRVLLETWHPPAPLDSGRLRAALDLSFTQVDDYLACPRKYRLRHEIRVPTAPHHALVVGKRAPSCGRGRQPGTPAGSGHRHPRRWNRPTDRAGRVRASSPTSTKRPAIRPASALSPDSRRASTRSLTPGSRPSSKPFSVHLGRDRIRGRYDAVVRSQDGVTVIDYKSGDVRDPGRARQRARDSLQLRLYALAWMAEHAERPAAVALHFLEGDQIGSVTPTDRQLGAAERQVGRAADGIRAGDFDATPGYPACDWCPYRRICTDAI